MPPPNALTQDPAPKPDRQRPERGPDEPPWDVWTAPAAVVSGLGLGILGTIVVSIVGRAGGSSLSHPTPAVSLISDLVFDASFVAVAIYFAALGSRPAPSDFGFRRIRLSMGLGAVALGGIAYYVLTAVYASLFKLHGSDKLPSELGVGKSTAALVGATIFVCVLAPMAEEFFFRGFFFGALRRWRIVIGGRNIGVWVAAVVTSILFGLAHTGSASPQYLIPLAYLGFVLCMIRWRTGSLYPCMALHSINNALALGVNQLGWNVEEIIALMAASLAVIGAITVPLSSRMPAKFA